MLTETQEDLILEIEQRHSSRITSFHIYKWLEQFNIEDYNTMLEVLLRLKFYTEEDIYESFSVNLEKIASRVKNYYDSLKVKSEYLTQSSNIREKSLGKRYRKLLKRVNPKLITAVGKYGKSGTAMIYYLTHSPFFRRKPNDFILFNGGDSKNINLGLSLKENIKLIKNRDLYTQIILIDDVIGTGKSLCKFINDDLLPYLKSLGLVKICLHVSTVVYLREGAKYIEDNIDADRVYFYGEKVKKVFASDAKVFGYKPRVEKIKEVCSKYGEGLCDSGYPDNISYPLGYEDSQMLVVFSHSTPNNTLPIFWSNRKKWYPLFPRNISVRLKNSKEFRKSLAVWVSVAKRLKLEHYFIKRDAPYETENLQMLSLIKLLHEKKSLEYIASILSISMSEIVQIIEIAKGKGLLTQDGILSDYARLLYEEVRIVNRWNKAKKYSFEKEILYLPKQFRGYS